jgi:hypothetical protein
MNYDMKFILQSCQNVRLLKRCASIVVQFWMWCKSSLWIFCTAFTMWLLGRLFYLMSSSVLSSKMDLCTTAQVSILRLLERHRCSVFICVINEYLNCLEGEFDPHCYLQLQNCVNSCYRAVQLKVSWKICSDCHALIWRIHTHMWICLCGNNL